ARAGLSVDLGRDHNVRASDAEVLEALPEQLLGLAEGVDVGGVNEIDARFQGTIDDRIDNVLAKIADRLPDAGFGIAAEGHRAEANLRNEKAGAAELVVSHEVRAKIWRKGRTGTSGPTATPSTAGRRIAAVAAAWP